MPRDLLSTPPKQKRRLPWWWGLALIGTVIYDVSPFDLIPEAVAGPLGLADDVLLTAVVLPLALRRSYLASSKKDVARTS